VRYATKNRSQNREKKKKVVTLEARKYLGCKNRLCLESLRRRGRGNIIISTESFGLPGKRGKDKH